jgi:hypothetical protein
VHACMRACVCVCVCMSVCVYVCMCVCMYTFCYFSYSHTNVPTYLCVFIYVCLYVCMFLCETRAQVPREIHNSSICGTVFANCECAVVSTCGDHPRESPPSWKATSLVRLALLVLHVARPM